MTSGSMLMFSAFEEGGPMWSGEGPRLETRLVPFDEPFVEPPVVHLSMGMWDIGVSANQRADLRAADVTRDGFKIEFRTWGDTQVARVRVTWMAIGPVRHLDDFNVD
ncbi:H-type lectin domain-containing protein [Paracoccus sp. MBLB3053]|uniref:H-type lectin domain-containing protein n=1 Tax=Paracoccus aurantius TaxID=3073814 RepID=A0ABU2HRI4_9RHOB|nr:H-type lectin domain-containing protein [Paracoccus sp. MBLB3053]MDS9467666.1 H-type lectin domain-containing protein [Paracoccus sp. MBLB3053]